VGILYNSVKKADVIQGMKRNMILEDLEKMGITETQEGVSIYQLSYDDLKYELVMASYRRIDIDNDSNGWF
jgi:hypothetical protein